MTTTFFPSPADVDLQAEIKEHEKGGYSEPAPEGAGALTPTDKSVKLFVGSLERVSLDIDRRIAEGSVDALLVSQLKVVGDLLIRMKQTNLAERRLVLAEAKQSAKRQAAEPDPTAAPSPTPVVTKCDPSSLKPQDSSLPAAKPRKRPREIFDPPRPSVVEAARKFLARQPQYAEYLDAKKEGWRPLPWIEESNRRTAAIQKREAEAEAAKKGSRNITMIDDDDDSEPTKGEFLNAVYQADPGFHDYQREQALSPEENARIRAKMAKLWQPREEFASPEDSCSAGAPLANST